VSLEIEIRVDVAYKGGLPLEHWTELLDEEIENEWFAYDGDIARWEIEHGLNGWRLTSLTWASPRGEPLVHGEYVDIDDAIAVIRDNDTPRNVN
jgi:hypothetical protein